MNIARRPPLGLKQPKAKPRPDYLAAVRDAGFTPRFQRDNMERPAGCLRHHGEPNRNGSHEDRVMAKRQLPSPEVLRQLLRYEPDTGRLFWRERPVGLCKSEGEAKRWNSRFSGRESTVTSTHGYRVVTVFDRQYQAHRICFAIHHGHHPRGEIDHINGVRTDNRASNLRDVTARDNATNRMRISRNKTGVCGVSRSVYGTYLAHVSTGSSRLYLGSFKTLDEAAKARKQAESEYGYSRGHGRPR